MNFGNVAVTEYFSLIRRVFFQGLIEIYKILLLRSSNVCAHINGLLSFGFLNDTNSSIGYQNEKNNRRFYEGHERPGISMVLE
jgi:hypothetical protein